MSKRTICWLAATALAGVTVVPADAATQLGRLFRGNKAIEFQQFQSASHNLTVEYPKRDWQIVSGAGAVVVTFAQKKSEASVTIEYEAVEQLEAKDITQLVADLEVDRIKGQIPGTDNFRKDIRDDENGRRLVIVDFTRPSVTTGVDRARQYSLVSAKKMYRITCSATTALFGKYDPVFQHMVASFKVGSPSAQSTSH
jgi:hypothetical protein